MSPKRCYKYVYLVEEVLDDQVQVKPGNLIFYRYVGKEYTFQAVRVRDGKPEIVPIMNVRLICILPDCKKETQEEFVKFLKNWCEKKSDKNEQATKSV